MDIQRWLKETSASDVMTCDVVRFEPQTTLAEVANQLLEHQISGGPVVSDGQCVGVFSANDLVLAEDRVNSRRVEFAQSSFWDGGLSLPVETYQQKLAAVRAKIAPVAQQPVSNFMTKDVISVFDSDSLLSIVDRMIENRVHRVVVLDRDGNLVGLISTMDVLKRLMLVGDRAMVTRDF